MRFECVVVLLPVLAATLSGCGLQFECTATALRCDGGTLEVCKTHPSGIDVSADPPSASRHSSSANTWDVIRSCGSASLCQTNAPVGIADPPTWGVCSLDPTTEPACAGDAGVTCSGLSRVTCQHGFVVERSVCASCAAGECAGGVHAPCSGQGECASVLTCVGGSCEQPCACSEGSPCTSCDGLGQSSQGDGLTWVCASGLCTLL